MSILPMEDYVLVFRTKYLEIFVATCALTVSLENPKVIYLILHS